jgi:hypothetical protein
MGKKMRENIRIEAQNDLLKVAVDLLSAAVPPHGAVYKNLFTLAGTSREYPEIEAVATFGCLPNHFAYSSIGIIEEVGRDWSLAGPGSVLLIPAHYSTYVVLNADAPADWGRLIFKIVPQTLDKTEALFLPLLCTALRIKERVEDPVDGALLFWGCGLLGTILLKLLALEDIHPVVARRGESTVRAELLWENGADSVITNPEDLPEKIAQVVLFAPEYPDLPDGGICGNSDPIDVRDESGGTHHGYAWHSHDIWQNAVGLIGSQRVTFKDLIAQHVHAEAVSAVERSIQTGLYHGGAIVYDW